MKHIHTFFFIFWIRKFRNKLFNVFENRKPLAEDGGTF